MSSKKNKIMNIVLIVIYFITLGVIIFLTQSNVFKKEDYDDTPAVVIPNSQYEKVEIQDLESKMKKLSFVNKKQDYIQDSITLNTSISDGKITISFKIGNLKKEYVISDIESPIAIGSYYIKKDDGTHISYILNKDGILYKVEDNIKEVKETEDYKGTPKDMGLTHVSLIAVDHKLKNTLLEDKTKVEPFVYIKTDDNRYFTDEKLVEGKDIVELIEKKVEEKKEENTSTES